MMGDREMILEENRRMTTHTKDQGAMEEMNYGEEGDHAPTVDVELLLIMQIFKKYVYSLLFL